MKTKPILLLSLALLLLIDACKKTQTNNVVATNSNQNLSKHGTGAILDHQAFLNAHKISIDEVRANLKASGLTPKFQQFTKSKQQIDNINPDLTPPSSVILLHPAIGDQGQTNTCESWAVGYCAKEVLDMTWQSTTADNGLRSGWFLYNEIYANPQYAVANYGGCSVNPDGIGLVSLDALNYAQRFGVASITAQPAYASCSPAPSSAAISSAATDKISSYGAVTNITTAKQLLAAGLPVLFAFRMYSNFQPAWENGTVWNTLGTIVYDQHGNKEGHAICLIGYDDSKNAFLAQNSWGTAFSGDINNPGCVWLDYNLVATLLAEGYSATNDGAETYAIQPISNTAVHLFYNTLQSKTFRPVCTTTTVTYNVPAARYSSPVSIDAANALAINDINTLGQSYVNTQAGCVVVNTTFNVSSASSLSFFMVVNNGLKTTQGASASYTLQGTTTGASGRPQTTVKGIGQNAVANGNVQVAITVGTMPKSAQLWSPQNQVFINGVISGKTITFNGVKLYYNDTVSISLY